MYILKNAWLSIKRNKGRNILVGIIVMVIACACAVTLAIKNSASTLIKSYSEEYQVEATIGVDRDSLMKNFNPKSSSNSKEDIQDKFSNIESIIVDDIKKYGESDYVSSYYYTESIGMNSTNIEKATSTSSNNGGGQGHEMPSNMNMGGTSTDFKVIGYSSIDAMSDFISGSYTITDGEVDTDFDNDSCVINSELATYNDLEVGDTITLVDADDSTKTYKLTIKGIYSDNNDSSNVMSMFSNSVNTIITSSNVVEKIIKKDSNLTNNVNPTFVLTGSSVVDKFSEELTNKGLSEYLTVSTNLDQVSEATSSIFNLSTFATTFLIITLVIGAVVLLIINMINIRERKYEIGVLRTIGMKKSLLTSQFVIELLIVSLVSLVLGTGLGALVSVPTANKLLENEINSSAEKMNTVSKNFGPTSDMGKPGDNGQSSQKQMPSRIQGVAKVEQIKSINAVVDYRVIMELLLIGVGITLVSSFAAMVSVQHFSPLTILKERS